MRHRRRLYAPSVQTKYVNIEGDRCAGEGKERNQTCGVWEGEKRRTSWFLSPCFSMACCAMMSPAPKRAPAVMHCVAIGLRWRSALGTVTFAIRSCKRCRKMQSSTENALVCLEPRRHLFATLEDFLDAFLDHCYRRCWSMSVADEEKDSSARRVSRV